MYDIAIIGGGALGCSSALWLARGGMKVALIERSGLCMEASGRNAGTLTLLYALARHGKTRGVAGLCLGGGNAVVLSVERI